jgi:hypothetical protein
MSSACSSHVPNSILNSRPHILVQVEFLRRAPCLVRPSMVVIVHSRTLTRPQVQTPLYAPGYRRPACARRSSSRPATRTPRSPQQLLSSSGKCATCLVLRPQSHRR